MRLTEESRESFSRGDAETACIILAIGADTFTFSELAAKLGLSCSHAGAIEEALAVIAAGGFLKVEDLQGGSIALFGLPEGAHSLEEEGSLQDLREQARR